MKEEVAKPKNDKAALKEQQMYQTAIDLLPDKKYEASGSKLRDYLKLYPKGAYVANAHYWLGEINFFLQKNYDAAEEEFKIVIDKYQSRPYLLILDFKDIDYCDGAGIALIQTLKKLQITGSIFFTPHQKHLALTSRLTSP